MLHAARCKYRTQKSRQKSPSGHHPTNLSGYIFATKACIDNRKKTCQAAISPLCSCAPVFNFVRLLPIGDNTKCRSPKNRKNWQKLGFLRRQRTTEKTDRDEISQVDVYHGSAIPHQIWPSSVKGVGTGTPQNVKICPKLWFLATGSRHNEHIKMKFGL